MEFSKDLLSLGTFWVGAIVILSFAMIGVIVMLDRVQAGEFVKAKDTLDHTFESAHKD